MKILTLNSGSNSLKFEIVITEPNHGALKAETSFGSSVIAGSYDNVGKGNSTFSLLENKRAIRQERVEVRDHGHATELLLNWIENGGAKERGIAGLGDIQRVGHRVVHGADQFDKPVEITDDVIRQIEDLENLAPLHNGPALKVIGACRARAGFGALMIADFDTVFHRTIPDVAALYPLPLDLAAKHRIRRYGFHGISHQYMTIRYAQITGRPLTSVNLITLHLEGGSSAAAIRSGQSIDTSMGFTPLEGLMMGTRCGDIDPAIVTYLMRAENLNAGEAESFLNRKCGLAGVSGKSADTRELAPQMDERQVRLALEMFSYRVRKYIGAYLAALGGAEAIVLGGGIGENTPAVRELIFKDLAWLGASLDLGRNKQVVDVEATINTPDSPVQIWVIPTQENLMMAADVADYAANPLGRD
jgi:acetate kinase